LIFRAKIHSFRVAQGTKRDKNCVAIN